MPKRTRPNAVGLLLKRNARLLPLYREAHEQVRLLHDVRRLLPDNIAPHCVAAQLKRGQLILHCDAAAWSTRLRFLAPQLLGALRPTHPGVANIKIKLQISGQPRKPVKRQAHHTAAGARTLSDCARNTASPSLKTALARLAKAVDIV